MADCINAEMRDLLPDLSTEKLSAVERSRVRTHVAGCSACAGELALIERVRGLPTANIHVDVSSIVARLPRPAARTAPVTDRSVVSLDSRRVAISPSSRPAASLAARARDAWKLAAALGVIVAGGWSVMMVRSGGIPNMQMQADSVPLSDLSGGGVRPPVASAATDSAATTAVVAGEEGAAISFGSVNDLTDEELTRALDQLEKWDGATSTEGTTTTPILPAASGGSRQ